MTYAFISCLLCYVTDFGFKFTEFLKPRSRIETIYGCKVLDDF